MKPGRYYILSADSFKTIRQANQLEINEAKLVETTGGLNKMAEYGNIRGDHGNGSIYEDITKFREKELLRDKLITFING